MEMGRTAAPPEREEDFSKEGQDEGLAGVYQVPFPSVEGKEGVPHLFPIDRGGAESP